jgi:thiamine-monophosphate kinase
MKLNELGEDAVVRGLTRGLKLDRRVILGPGDDCAVVKTAGKLQLLKSDCIIEGVHFLPDADPLWVGWKAMVGKRCAARSATLRRWVECLSML